MCSILFLALFPFTSAHTPYARVSSRILAHSFLFNFFYFWFGSVATEIIKAATARATASAREKVKGGGMEGVERALDDLKAKGQVRKVDS